MAIIKTDEETGEIIHLSNAQIKEEIQKITGWTTKQYQNQYDKLRNKLRNYEAVIGQKRSAAVNEELYKMVINERTTGLTERQKAIQQFTSATTGSFRERAAAGKVSARQQSIAIDGLVEGSFRGLLSRSETTRTEFDKWKRDKIAKGETVTAKEVNRFLGKQAKDLHRRQKAEYDANKAYYDDTDSYPGSD